MPVINMDISDLGRLIGDGFDLGVFKERIPMIGATVEREEGSEISVEFFPDRPDLFSVEGVARAYRSFITSESGDPENVYRPGDDSDLVLEVDGNILDVRPVIAGAYITGVMIDERALLSIMNLQEKLHLTLGRRRKKVAIGIHDASPLKPPFRYWAAGPEEVRFVPLQKEGEWDLRRILEEHEKGMAYADILAGLDRYPMITDSEGKVLSFPPIINGELTRVKVGTRDIFVDCTGWDRRAVSLAVNIVCSQLMDRGGELHRIEVRYPDIEGFSEHGLKSGKWPEYRFERWDLDLEWASRWLGIDLTEDEATRSMKAMGYPVERIKEGGLRVGIPPWRGDILHQADLVEDLAVGFGFENFKGKYPRMQTTGTERDIRKLTNLMRETMVGLGYLEVKTISLSNEETQFTYMGREERDHVSIRNPINTEHTMLRDNGLPSLMNLLRANKHRDLPQRLFEVADVVVGNMNRTVLTAVSEDSRSSFTEIKGVVERLLSDLDMSYVPAHADLPWYIRGRAASIMVEGKMGVKGLRGKDVEEAVIGHFGEVHPRLISGMELGTPVTALEMDMTYLTSMMRDRS